MHSQPWSSKPEVSSVFDFHNGLSLGVKLLLENRADRRTRLLAFHLQLKLTALLSFLFSKNLPSLINGSQKDCTKSLLPLWSLCTP